MAGTANSTATAVAPVVALANRLPFRLESGEWIRTGGGLVAALEAPLRERGGTWIGWSGSATLAAEPFPADGFTCCPLHLEPHEVEGYYDGFANQTLWPLLHGMVEHCRMDRDWWIAYRGVNARFAGRAATLLGPESVAWVHDYHLMLVPELLRRAGHARVIAFLHVPFPPADTWARLPWGRDLLVGLLGARVVGFQTARSRHNFVDACLDAGLVARLRGDRLTLADGRTVDARVDPISVDVKSIVDAALSPATRRLRDAIVERTGRRRLLLGVDRLDYTKGILERLTAFELLLERRPDLRDSVAFVQIASPTRDAIAEYEDLRSAVEALVGRINGRFTTVGGQPPVIYLHRSVDFEDLVALYTVADVAVVTPLNDGMNLVAKEYVVAQAAVGGSGALVLSRFAGAADELHDAILCNPFHADDLARALDRALTMPRGERRLRVLELASQIRANDVHRWAAEHLRALPPWPPRGSGRVSSTEGAATRYRDVVMVADGTGS